MEEKKQYVKVIKDNVDIFKYIKMYVNTKKENPNCLLDIDLDILRHSKGCIKVKEML